MNRSHRDRSLEPFRGFTLDAGALIAVERGDHTVGVLLHEAAVEGVPVVIPAGALAQAWREGRRQARLARLLKDTRYSVLPLDEPEAKAAGELCGARGTSDVVDASVVLCARQRGHVVLTSDPDDLRRLDPHLRLVALA